MWQYQTQLLFFAEIEYFTVCVNYFTCSFFPQWIIKGLLSWFLEVNRESLKELVRATEGGRVYRSSNGNIWKELLITHERHSQDGKKYMIQLLYVLVCIISLQNGYL